MYHFKPRLVETSSVKEAQQNTKSF